jgi:hypothetical protein
MRTRRVWPLPAATVVLGAFVILSVPFGRLGDGSFECPGNAWELSRHPLPEDRPPVDGFYAAPACNHAARDRWEAMPWVFGGASAAVIASVVVPLGLNRASSRRRGRS